MSDIDDSLDIVTAARRLLMTQTSVTSLLGSSTDWPVWLFKHRLWESVVASGQAAVVLLHGGSWTSPNPHNTMRFPRLRVQVYADLDRSGENPQSRTAEDRALDVFAAINAVLHRPDPGEQVLWGDGVSGGVRVLNSTLQGEPDLDDMPGGDGIVVASFAYGVTVG